MFKKKYIALALTAAVLVTFLLVTNNCKDKEIKDFNVVLIVIDTLRSDHLPFYGYEKNTAPFLGELAKKSVVFENAFSASSWTSPGTASIFTSLYPYQHGVLMGLLAIRTAQKINPDLEVNRIPEEITTITEVLKNNGYKTYGVSDNLNIGERQGFTQGFDKFRTFMYKQAPAVNSTIKKWHKQMTAKGKYFLYIQYMEPHAPYHPREPWYEPHDDKKKNRISAYDSEINFVDQHIKELYELFQWDKNTIIIVTADHGEGLWDHGIMGHGKTLYREEIQVPLMVYLPGGSLSGRVSTNVGTIDILPTVRELTGLPEGETDEGVSLVPIMEKRDHHLDKRDLFAYLWVKMEKTIEWKSTIYKKWQFIIKMPDFRHLYSLLMDKRQQNNKFAEGQKTAAQLEQRFEAFKRMSKKFKQKSTKIKMDKKKTDKLKSLGYVH
ncbi:MAG: sulfatase [bacterium]|nr:sulfatase [bacterium]